MEKLKELIHGDLYNILIKKGIKKLTPVQEKAVKAGLFENKNLLVCSPTSSGKTLIAELAGFNSIMTRRGKAIYIVPLKALANEKFKEFKEFYGEKAKIALSIGDMDSPEPHLANYDLIITTSEKLDSLIRHHCPWLRDVATIIIDEIHFMNDPGRGPTLEILITMLREILSDVQIIALSATVGNPEQIAEWLDAELVQDSWRPVPLYKGVYLNGEIEFK